MIARRIAPTGIAILFVTSLSVAGSAVDLGEPILFRYARLLAPNLRAALDPMIAYDRTVFPDDANPLSSFTPAQVDLDGKDPPELAIPIRHALSGIAPSMYVILARWTPDGWRFIGSIEASIDWRLQGDLRTEAGFFEPALYLEEAGDDGWRILNTGPRWENSHLNGEIDAMGGWRYCWTDKPSHENGEPDLSTTWGLPYDSGGPGYFDVVYIEEDCP